MKKSFPTIIRLIVLGVIVSVGFAPLIVVAAMLSLSPANINITQGQNLTVNIALNPQGAANYTVKVELRYAANLVEVRSFTFGNGWLPLTQSGYDSVDNTNGVLVKTAGYPGGVSSPITFGTVSFRAKGAGSGNITIGTNSSVFNAVSQNVLSGLPVLASITVKAPVATPVVTPILTVTVIPTVITSPEVGEEVVGGPQNLLAQIGFFITLGTDRIVIGALVVLALLYVVYAILKRMRRKKE